MTPKPQKIISLLKDAGPGVRLGTRAGGVLGFVFSSQVAFIERTNSGETVICLAAGGTAAAALDYNCLREVLDDEPGWIRSHRDVFCNLRNLREIGPWPTSDNPYELIFTGGHRAPLTKARAPAFKGALGMKRLDHVVPFNRVAYWIKKEGLRDIGKRITRMSVPELKEHFADSTGSIVASDLVANFIWQKVNFIRSGNDLPLDGANIRTLWYLLKPTMSRAGLLGGMDHYKTLSEKLAHFVAHHIMSYREFGFYEAQDWQIGGRNPHIIGVAEKQSYIRSVLQPMQAELGVSIIATGGQPRTITSEYFTETFKKKVSNYWKPDRVRVISLVDYDPAGWVISSTFLDDLGVFGIKHPHLIDLIIPGNLTPEEVERNKYYLFGPEGGEDADSLFSDRLSPGRLAAWWRATGRDPEDLAALQKEADKDGGFETLVRKWIRATGGINGEPYGLETEAFVTEEEVFEPLKRLFRKAAAPYLED